MIAPKRNDDGPSIPDILSGPLKHVATIASQRTGKRPAQFTIHRWCTKGNCKKRREKEGKGPIKLAAVWTGSYWATTEAAFDQFLAEQTAARLQESLPDSASDDDLRAAGLL